MAALLERSSCVVGLCGLSHRSATTAVCRELNQLLHQLSRIRGCVPGAVAAPRCVSASKAFVTRVRPHGVFWRRVRVLELCMGLNSSGPATQLQRTGVTRPVLLLAPACGWCRPLLLVGSKLYV